MLFGNRNLRGIMLRRQSAVVGMLLALAIAFSARAFGQTSAAPSSQQPSIFGTPGVSHRIDPQRLEQVPADSSQSSMDADQCDADGRSEYVFPRLRLLDKIRAFGSAVEAPHPITQESWLQRPLSVTWFMGGLEGSTLISDWVDAEQGILGGLCFGWDVSHYWGLQMRLAFGTEGLHDSQRAIDSQEWEDTLHLIPRDDPYRRRFDGRRDATLFLWDFDILFYPWGDRPWRPYFMVGLGTAFISFEDRLSQTYNNTQFGMPIGIGLKLRLNDSLALRFECADNVAIGSGGINTLQQFSFVGGAEFRFGGSRIGYWPWNPGRR
jgi:hypothetical protein